MSTNDRIRMDRRRAVVCRWSRLSVPAGVRRILIGVGSVIDLGATLRPSPQLPPTALRGLQQDWRNVGASMWAAMQRIENQR